MHKTFVLVVFSLLLLSSNIYSCRDGRKQNHNNNMVKTYDCSVVKGVSLPINEDRGGHAGGVVDGKIIIVGGNRWSEDKGTKFFLSDALIFDDHTWVKGPELPEPIANPMFGSDSSGLYIAGGTSDGVVMSEKVFVLRSISTRSRWERLPDLPEGVGLGAGAIVNGSFYVSGGTLNNGKRTNKMWALTLSDPEAGWRECEPIPGVERMLHAFVGSGESLYVLGGLAETSPLTPLNDMYRYDYLSGKWEILADLPEKGYAWVAQPIDEANVLITGKADGQIHSGVWMLDLETSQMETVGDLVIQSTTAPLIHVSRNEWWLVGGEPDSKKNRTREVSIIKLISKKL
jgi:N-acetylneuraminic acid mutarotase